MALQARTEFAAAINQIASEKGVDTDVILEAIRQAALAAYRKDLSYRNEAIPDDFDSLEARLNPQSGEIGIYRGDENVTPPGFARIAAQTAKQVIAQKLHEAEKGAIFDEYQGKIGSVVSGAIQRQEGNTYFVDLGRAEGVMPPSEQIRDEYYGQNSRMKFLIKEIRESGRGPEVVVSRSDAALVKGLFAMEVPEIQSGAVEIKEIAREAGGRTKVGVISNQEGVDPVGSLVGQKGVRVQAVINELGEEKIDIVLFSEDQARFIAAALSPAKDIQVELNEKEKVAKVKIPDNQLSLAIGKGGQNVRLAAKLTGWKIDIEGTGEGLEEEGKEGSGKREEKTDKNWEDAGKKVAADSAKATSAKEEGLSAEAVAEAGTKEHEQQVGAVADDNAVAGGVADDTKVAKDKKAAEVVEDIEENIEKAIVEESVDGKTQKEEAVGEGKKADEAAAQAETDMEAVEKSEKSGEPDESETIETAPAADFEKVESAFAKATADKEKKSTSAKASMDKEKTEKKKSASDESTADKDDQEKAEEKK